MDFQGEIETQITLDEVNSTLIPELTAWAESRGLKFVHILLDRGFTPSQPMFIRTSEVTWLSELAVARELISEIESLGFKTNRIKLTVPPSNEDVPQGSGRDDFPRYFEHHVKTIVPGFVNFDLLEDALKPHLAHLSRNANKIRPDGQQERFITQRCHRVGREDAKRQLDPLLELLRKMWIPILEVKEEYVVYDTNLELDDGWLEGIFEVAKSSSYPNTLRTLNPNRQMRRPHVFDPAFRHFRNAFRLGEANDLTADEYSHIRAVRTEVRNHLLHLIAGSKCKEHLILRGSSLTELWFGDRARDPKDIDWVFRPAEVRPAEPVAEQCMRSLVELVRQNRTTPNAEIQVCRIAIDDIWTYERAEGRRIIFPFRSSQGVEREVQIDIVWQESLTLPPAEIDLVKAGDDEVKVWAASKEESLAWKILWLVTDSEPQSKDLYDAVLLAESISITPGLLKMIGNKIVESDPDYYAGHLISASGMLKKIRCRDWEIFQKENPWIGGEFEHWHNHLVDMLDLA